MNPPIVDDYPYMLTNRSQVMSDYADANVLLSISGHYHAGQDATEAGGVRYFTAPALCNQPFRYSLLTLAGRDVRIQTHALQLPSQPPLVDCHVHTQFAFCGRGLKAASVERRARALGLSGVVLTEHAPQLYCLADDFWVGAHIRRPELWRGNDHNRAADFRRQVLPLRSGFARIGLEVELDAKGRLTLHPEDVDIADVLVGAVHFLPLPTAEYSDPGLSAMFMQVCEGLLAAGVDVLAHPLRLFRWGKRAVPRELFAPLATMLAHYGAAAEINFHSNTPDADFLAECLKRNVKIAFGSDAHMPSEMGALRPHLAMLHAVAGTTDVSPLLWQP